MARKRNRKAKKDIFIAVMGPTGTGKSTFINLVTQSNKMSVGHGLESHTGQVQRSDPIELSGRRVFLLDTPGFYDTHVAELDVLRQIALTLHTTYEQGFLLSGVVYMHSIKTPRMSGSRRKNLLMFRELCGTEALKNVAVVTSMWDVVDRAKGEQQERLLVETPDCFKPLVDSKACVMRHDNTHESAITIIRRLIGNDPLPLQIQQQLVEQGMQIIHTSAAKYLWGPSQDEPLEKRNEHRKREERETIEALLDISHDKHKGRVKELGEEYAAKVGAFEEEQRRLACQYEEEKAAADVRVAQAKDALAQVQAEKVTRMQEITRLKKQLDEGKRLDSEKKGQLEADIRKLEEEMSSRRTALTVTFRVLAVIMDVAVSAATGAPLPMFSILTRFMSRSEPDS